MNRFGLASLIVIGVLLLLVLYNLFQPAVVIRTATQLPFSEVLGLADAGTLRDVVIAGHTMRGQTSEGRVFQTYLPDDPTLARDLAAKHVTVVVNPPEDEFDPLARLALTWLPTFLLSAIWLYWLRRIVGAIDALNTTMKSSRGPILTGAVRDAGTTPGS